MRFAVAIAIIAFLAPAAYATNSLVEGELDPYVEVVGGATDMSIVVYNDDYYGYQYVIQALNQLGYGYTHYYADYAGFEAAVASGMYDLVIVNHETYYEGSYAWDDIYFHLLDGKAAIVATFDWDASNDYSGYCWTLLSLAGHSWYADLYYTLRDCYVWVFDPIYTGTDGVLEHAFQGYYDEGDYLSGSGESGWTTGVTDYAVNCNIWCGDYTFVVFAMAMDERPAGDAIQTWKNAINWVYWGASATDATSWGGVKAMYK